ncbi:hypothetical protein A4R35_23260 [Thermogemmatispora tikiterensis]|uniref:Uncharacterized protein n=1 Tax=Thermogemmatispora tikiterensis TaxID=1825093 RepID=A0A328VRX3_9CHLR|nr:hypothetical protein A4R35_23260 [Thermogemmatispora tikiterensis]
MLNQLLKQQSPLPDRTGNRKRIQQMDKWQDSRSTAGRPEAEHRAQAQSLRTLALFTLLHGRAAMLRGG